MRTRRDKGLPKLLYDDHRGWLRRAMQQLVDFRGEVENLHGTLYSGAISMCLDFFCMHARAAITQSQK